MSSLTIRAFNPFDLQKGSNIAWHRKVQEVVYYGESRFCAACTKISQTDGRHQFWMQKALKRELLFVMSYIGIAMAIGLVVDVPIILRSLADSLMATTDQDLPLEFDSGFLDVLAVGTKITQVGRVVNKYKFCWWMQSRLTGYDSVLHEETLDTCLETHHEELAKPPPGACRTALQSSPLRQPLILAPIPPLQLSTDTIPDHHLSLAGNAVDKLRSIQVSSGSQFHSINAQKATSICKAAGLYMLHEAVLLKETAIGAAAMPFAFTSIGAGSEAMRRTRQVQERAQIQLEKGQAELERVKALHPSSHKWTWGETLSETDILTLDEPSKLKVRSGYDHSLPAGGIQKKASVLGSIHPGTNSSVSESVHAIPPDYSFDHPERFRIQRTVVAPSVSYHVTPSNCMIANVGEAVEGDPYGDGDFIPDVDFTVVADNAANMWDTSSDTDDNGSTTSQTKDTINAARECDTDSGAEGGITRSTKHAIAARELNTADLDDARRTKHAADVADGAAHEWDTDSSVASENTRRTKHAMDAVDTAVRERDNYSNGDVQHQINPAEKEDSDKRHEQESWDADVGVLVIASADVGTDEWDTDCSSEAEEDQLMDDVEDTSPQHKENKEHDATNVDQPHDADVAAGRSK